MADPADYQAAHDAVALHVRNTGGILKVSGTDAAEFLQNMVSNDISVLKSGEGCRAAFLTSKGKILADFIVLADGEMYWLVLPYAPPARLMTELGRFIVSEDVLLEDVSQEMAVISLIGPAASRLVAGLGAAPPDRPYSHRVAAPMGVQFRMVASRGFGLGGVDFLVPKTAMQNLQTLLERGNPVPVPLGDQSLEVIRVEAGESRYGVDMNENNLLMETGLEEAAVSFQKGCYVGQEFVARIAHRGQVAKHLCGVEFEGSIPPSPGDSIFLGHDTDRPAGEVRSAVYSPSLGKPIALAYVVTRHDQTDEVLVRSGNSTLRGRLCGLPFYHP